MMPENNWYGHTFVLARYCGMRSLTPPIFGSVPHGWRLDYTTTSPGTLSSAPLLVWNDRHAEAATAVGVQHVVKIGAPFVYAAHSLVKEIGPVSPAGRGTLFMPGHSVRQILTNKDHRQLITEVEATEEGPFSVALFYIDLARDEVRHPYEEAGWRVVSFGRRDQDLYLYRIITEMLHHQTLISDDLSTAIWYGAHLGRRVRIVDPGRRDLTKAQASTHALARDLWPRLFDAGAEGEEAIDLADAELGASSMLPASELTNALGWSTWRRPLANTVRLAVDIRHGGGFRRGV
jgi:hypothetical protein